MLNILWVLIPTVLLMLVNGWTDAPVTVATAVSSGAVGFKKAILLSAVCNFAGGLVMSLFGSSVAVSVFEISGLGGQSAESLPCLISAVLTVVLWSLSALKAGLPTSESHALLSALSGSGVAAVGFSAFNGTEWLKVITALLLSGYPLAVLSYFAANFTEKHLKLGEAVFKKLQVLGAALSSFSHGAQDGQKFAGILAVALSLSRYGAVEGETGGKEVTVPFWTVLFSAAMITVGCVLGGRRIIGSLRELAPATAALGFAADFTSAVSLSIMAVLGLPAATTVAKTVAIWGAGRTTEQKSSAEPFKRMLTVWGLTFPVCFCLGYVLSKVLIFVTSAA